MHTMTNTDELTIQARELVLKLLGQKRQVLNEDQPWKLTVRRMLDGKDVSLGELTEVFRALGARPQLSFEPIMLIVGHIRIAYSDHRAALQMMAMLQGRTVPIDNDGGTMQLSEAEVEFYKKAIKGPDPAGEKPMAVEHAKIEDLEAERKHRRQQIIDGVDARQRAAS